jgi:adenosylmethionine---8-amino-7-oxononanoate aminotransferase
MNTQKRSARESDQFKHLWMPFTYFNDQLEHPPIIIERGSGVYVYDKDGRGYIDAIGSWWTSIFGHNHPFITNAVKAQLDKIEHVMMAGFISEPALRLSQLLGAILPKKLTRIFYSDDGSTAVEVALKIALQYHALRGDTRSEFVSFDGGYHGDTLGAMSVGSIPMYHSLFHERFKKQHFANSPYCYRCPVGCEPVSCNAECMDSLEQILQSKEETIAACIFEPMVQGAVGMRIYPSKVLKRIFSLCRQYNILTIADEVAMGLGRTGKLFACEHAEETPDIMCLAKGLTGGYLPLSATIVTEAIFEEFQGDFGSERIFNHGHTFTGNPLATAAACAAVNLLQISNIPESLHPIIQKFAQRLENFRKYDVVGDIRTLGLVGAIELVKNKKTKEPLKPQSRFAWHVAQKALEHGCIIRPLGDILYFMPPFIMNEEQLDNMISITEKALKDTIDEHITDIR